MLGETVICLAVEVSQSDCAGGFWTPAAALGGRLLQRLQTNAGLTFERIDA
jgi:short subunit dehydrogenase-like uncharacterized protein